MKTTEERINEFTNLCITNNIQYENLLTWLKKNGFFTAPASTKYHGNYEGGLFDHSLAVTRRLIELTKDNSLEWQREESPFIVGMFHDLCKCDQYKFVPNEYMGEPGHYEYNTNTLLKGHGTKSIMLISQFITLTEEEMLCIRYHMGAYGNETEQNDEWAGFDRAIRKYETVLYTHTADQLASKVDNI